MGLLPCPACDGEAQQGLVARYAFCLGAPSCGLVGPSDDPDGAKWNALPRRTDEQEAKAAAFDAALAAFEDPLENDRWVAAGLSALLAAERAKRKLT